MSKIIYVTKPTAKARKAEKAVKKAFTAIESNLKVKLVVAIGGDGTLLHAVRQHSAADVIFVGVFAGSLGLLQTVEVADVNLLVNAIKNNTYETIKAPMLAAAFCEPVSQNAKDDKRKEIIGYAFNDISVERSGSKAAKFHLRVDGSAGTFIGDGIIFATPLGSTAYSLAAGGPIIDSETEDSFVVTPNNPHISAIYSSLQKPHVLSKKRKVRIEVSPEDKDEHSAKLVIDGETAVPIISSPLNVYLSSHSVRLLQLTKEGLYNRIEAKRLGRL